MKHENQHRPGVRRRKRKQASDRVLLDGQKISLRSVNDLQNYSHNPRKHDARQIGQLKNSISAFGFMNPIIVDAAGIVIAGHGRLQAAVELGLQKVPVIAAAHLSEAKVRAYRLADNKIAENSSWDEGLLRIELAALVDLEFSGDLEFDVDAIGFETAELDILLGDDPEDDKPEVVEGPSETAVCRSGETWVLGEHQIACMSALEGESYRTLLNGNTPSLIITDPPYNVPVRGHIRTSTSAKHREFAMASGEMSSSEFADFLTRALGHSVSTAVAGTVMMSFIDWRHLRELDTACSNLGLEQINLCVWVKTSGGMGSLYRSQHELCAIYKLPGANNVNNVRLVAMGRNRTNVWRYSGVNTFGRNRAADLVDHPTVKPVAMIEDAIKDVTKIGDYVLDSFGGSGTTLLAAERSRRRARLLEIDPLYVDVTIRRWQDVTGGEAYKLGTEETWNERRARPSGPLPGQED